MRTLFVYFLSFLILAGCYSSESNKPSTQKSNLDQPTPQASTNMRGGTIGNGASVIETENGLVMADSYYDAPDYKLPDFYIARIGDFERYFPGLNSRMQEIINLLNRRYGDEVIRFDPKDYEFYITRKFSKNHVTPFVGGRKSQQAAYAYVFKSINRNLTKEIQHRVVEIGPQVRTWPLDIQALVMLHEISHHHPNLGFDEYYHRLIASLIDGTDTLLKILKRQNSLMAENRLDEPLSMKDLDKLQRLQRALEYMSRGKAASEDNLRVEFFSCRSPFRRIECEPNILVEHPRYSQNVFTIVAPKGGGVIEVIHDFGASYYGNWPTESLWTKEFFTAEIVAALKSNYVSVDSAIQLRAETLSASETDDKSQPTAPEFVLYFKDNVFINTNLEFYLRQNSECMSNRFVDLPGTFKFISLLGPSEYFTSYSMVSVTCDGAKNNWIEDLVIQPSNSSSSDKKLLLMGSNNVLKHILTDNFIFLKGQNSIIEKASINVAFRQRRLGVGSNVRINDAVISGNLPIDQWPWPWPEPDQNQNPINGDNSKFSPPYPDRLDRKEYFYFPDNYEVSDTIQSGSFRVKLSPIINRPANKLGLFTLTLSRYEENYNIRTYYDKYIPWLLFDTSAIRTDGKSCNESSNSYTVSSKEALLELRNDFEIARTQSIEDLKKKDAYYWVSEFAKSRPCIVIELTPVDDIVKQAESFL